MEGRGARLKKIRLEKGLSLEEVYKKTKIHLNILKAIEDDNLVNLNPIYVKGFIKIYCKLLGENPADFIKDFKEPRTRIELKPETRGKIFPDAGFSKLRNLKLPVILKTAVFAVAAIVLIYVFVGIIRHIAFKPGRSAADKKQIAAIQTVTPLQKQQKKSEPSKMRKQSGQTVLIRVGIRARENCFIQLKTDGKIVFQGILKKGRFESWQAKERIDLSLGNAGAVDLEVNGKLISNLGRKGQALKNIVINQEGLSIGR